MVLCVIVTVHLAIIDVSWKGDPQHQCPSPITYPKFPISIPNPNIQSHLTIPIPNSNPQFYPNLLSIFPISSLNIQFPSPISNPDPQSQSLLPLPNPQSPIPSQILHPLSQFKLPIPNLNLTSKIILIPNHNLQSQSPIQNSTNNLNS